MSKNSSRVLMVKGSSWVHGVSIGRGKSYRRFDTVADVREYAASKGYRAIHVHFGR